MPPYHHDSKGAGTPGAAPGVPRLAETVLTRFWLKAFGTTGFTFLFFVAYLYLLRHPLFPVHSVPLTPLDRWIDFQPLALPVYLSLWLYVSLPPMLMLTRAELIGYGWRVAVPCVAGLAVFLFWPNAVPPADIDWSRHPGVLFLKHVDTAGNACPSLHVATAVFSCCWLFWRLPLFGPARALQLGNLLWCAGIAYSTVAVRQHVVLDVIAGAALGLGTAWLTGLRAHASRLWR